MKKSNLNRPAFSVPTLAAVLAAVQNAVEVLLPNAGLSYSDHRFLRVEAYQTRFEPLTPATRGLPKDIRDKLAAGVLDERRHGALHLGYIAIWGTFATEISESSIFHVVVTGGRLKLVRHTNTSSSSAPTLTFTLEELAVVEFSELLAERVRPETGHPEVLKAALLSRYADLHPGDVCTALRRFFPEAEASYTQDTSGCTFSLRAGHLYLVGSMGGEGDVREVRLGDEVLFRVSLDSEAPYGPWTVNREVLSQALADLNLPPLGQDEDPQRRWCPAPVSSSPVVLELDPPFATAN